MFALAIAGTVAEAARGGIIMFTDRPTWAAAATPTGGENFNGFASDTSFQNTNVPINNGTVTGQPGTNGALSNKIDVPPFEFSGSAAIDSTAYLFGDLSAGELMTMTFTIPVTGWGADFRGIGNPPRITTITIYDASNVVIGTITTASDSSNAQLQFYGFTTMAGQTGKKLVFANSISSNDAFGIDNIQFAVPEPSGVAGVVLASLAALGRRRSRRVTGA